MLDRNDESALSGIDDRINSMERRLRNAKAARDSYIEYLRGKYPTWNPSLSSFKLEHNAHEPLVNRLATSEYQWDLDSEREKRRRPTILFSQNNELSQNMPTSGPLLESDIRHTKRRLLEISAQLKTLRGSRMSMSTDQFMRFAPFMANQREKISLATSEDNRLNRLDNVRQRLSDIALSGGRSPVLTPTEEQREDVRMEEERDKMMADIRSGLVSTNWDTSYSTNTQNQNIGLQYSSQQPIELQPVSQGTKPKEEQSVSFAEPVVEPKIQTEPIASTTPSFQPVQPTQPVKQEPVKPLENQFSLLKLLNQNNDDSNEDSDLPTTSAAKQAPKPQAAPKVDPPKSSAGMGLLSQYLKKADSSDSSDDQIVSNYKPPVPISKPPQSMSKSFMDAGDSDDDFFN